MTDNTPDTVQDEHSFEEIATPDKQRDEATTPTGEDETKSITELERKPTKSKEKKITINKSGKPRKKHRKMKRKKAMTKSQLDNLKKGVEARRKFSYAETGAKEMWTKELSLAMGERLIEWMIEKDTNIFFKEYLLMFEEVPPKIIPFLCNKFPEFSDLIDIAKGIQEIKLVKWSTAGKLNSTMTKFVLSNMHAWRERHHIETEEKDRENDYEDEFKDVIDEIS